MFCPGPWHLAVLTASPCGNSGALTQAEEGHGSMKAQYAQGPEVSWDLPFHTRRSCFDLRPGLGTAPMYKFCAPGL